MRAIRLEQIGESDRGTLGDVSQFCNNAFATARNPLILKRRDGGVVDRARLESVFLVAMRKNHILGRFGGVEDAHL